ncbi:pyocin knob domain-containing protein [Pseudoalteromonas sp. SR41-7]|uniref:pyocin knob domain-containing protein n=1 Tax=Pseudoalteromonas sp. SR41-7 TaxID=2760947 RepID=UPI0015FF041E|nr:pyocin knob domain-containing protein [Pseudoalteromonas sp. SR41-7]MBB1299218.1 hypothetical protein [Pseudoalteromonas sp. SR41-7]
MAASAGAWYRVGTVNVTNGSAAIVGVGSNWQNDVIAIAIGDAFTIDAKTWYEVISVNDDTSITLDRGFEGATASDVEYAILRNTSGTILTRIAGQIAVQFNQKQLFLDELRNWLTSEDETATLTDSHGIAHVVKTVNKIQELTGTAATRDVTTSNTDTTTGRLLKVGDFGISGKEAPPFSNTLNYDSNEVYSGIHRITSSSPITLPAGVSSFGVLEVSRYGSPDMIQVYTAITQDKMLFRRIQGEVVSDWQEIYHSGNTNFTTLKGENVGDQLGQIAYRNTTTLYMVKDISGYRFPPSSITCTGTFKIVNQNGVDIITGISTSDLSMESLTSSKRLKVRISNVDPTLLTFGGDITYELAAETAGATIEVNP